MLFSSIMEELRMNIDTNRVVIESSLNKNPALAFHKINELAHFVGRRYNMEIYIHFPDSSKIKEVISFGTENLGIIIDKSKKKFPIPKENIKRKARDMKDFIEAKDAYMYEGKEGVRVFVTSGRLEIQPGAIHLWCKVDRDVTSFVDWLMQYVYLVRKC
jgi:hypothetical protein